MVLLTLLCFPVIATAQPVARGDDETLVKEITTAIDVPGLQSGFQGIVIQSLKDGRTLYELNSEKAFLPASNNKLLTSGIALETLPPDFAYHTRVTRTGTLSRRGVLNGDLILVGSGDPLLTPENLKTLAQKVRQAGIRRVTGALRYDDSLFDQNRLGPSWSWDDEPFSYSAQVSALNVNGNTVSIQVLPGEKINQPVRYRVLPSARYTRILNTAITGMPNGKAAITVDRLRGTNTILIKGSLPLRTPEKSSPVETVTVNNPSLFTLSLFWQYLGEYGVEIQKNDLQAATPPYKSAQVAEVVSSPLPEILKRLNKPSNNLVAECLLKTVGAAVKQKGTFGADGTGSTTTRDWLLRIGGDVDRVRMDDGSGLSRTDYVTPRNIVRLLTYLQTTEQFPAFYDSLPIAGVDGTLSNRMKNTAAANNCRAKTGTLSFVCSLSGYVTTKDGEKLVFSILMNNHLAPSIVARAAQDKIVTLLADYSRPALH